MDTIEKLNNSTIQHGKYNDRIYLMKLAMDDYPLIINQLDMLAEKNQYSKIFVKIPSKIKDKFIKEGYRLEAIIPDFYNHRDDACFMGKYLSDIRGVINNKDLIEKIIKVAIDKGKDAHSITLNEEMRIAKLSCEDAAAMAAIYQKVFQSYPFPIHDPEYLIKTMDENIVYYGVFKDKELIALSSCEIDEDNLNVEMTDFACLTEYRGNNIAYSLLKFMEEQMKKSNMRTFYTIARAESYGMNITFAKLNYHYAGTLINNTNISSGIESMNVWYKRASIN